MGNFVVWNEKNFVFFQKFFVTRRLRIYKQKPPCGRAKQARAQGGLFVGKAAHDCGRPFYMVNRAAPLVRHQPEARGLSQ